LILYQPKGIKGNDYRRIIVLCGMICALIRGGQASLQKIGEHLESKADLESRIKQAKRWLTSKWTDVEVHFVPYIRPILISLSTKGELILAIDGSTIGKDCMALMVSVIWRNRAIPIVWLVRQAPKGHFPEKMHLELINQLASLFKSIGVKNCPITLLGDGEFDGNDLQKDCLSQGWNYVCKTAKTTLIADNKAMENPSKMGDLQVNEGTNHLMLNDMYVTKQAFGLVNIIYWHDLRYKKPMYWLTNLECALEAEWYYRKRFIIETFFSDIKSRGFNIHRTRISNPETLFNLLIVACLAFILSILFEFDARKSPYLADFCRKDRINDLSVFQLGYRGIKHYAKKGMQIIFDFSKNFP